MSKTTAKDRMAEFLDDVFGPGVHLATDPDLLDLPAGLGKTWTAKLKDGRMITIQLSGAISVIGQTKAPAPTRNFSYDQALNKFNRLRTSMGVPKEWRWVDAPTDFISGSSKPVGQWRFDVSHLPPGFRYGHPHRSFGALFDSRTGQILSVCFRISSSPVPERVKIDQPDAVRLALAAAKAPSSLVIQTGIGLGFAYSDDQRQTLRPTYCIPLADRRVVEIDAEFGTCLAISQFK
ncbi:MAG: hypothetical protein JST12_00705 [Armatimonadetes bacterium]|nr:hypothetical protein [Armatimonadota bacterium]